MDFRKVKAVLFDLDGTLLDTVQDIGTCINDVLCRYGFPPRKMEEFPAFLGHGRLDAIKKAVPEGTSEEMCLQISSEYAVHYRENCDRRTAYYPGVCEFLNALQKSGYVLGVITNKTQETADRIMSKYFPDYSFELLWGNNGKRPLKPSLESAELACKTLGLKPEEILFVGDGDTDMQFASRAGFLACGVTWGYRSRAVLEEYGAHILVDSYDELEKLFFA